MNGSPILFTAAHQRVVKEFDDRGGKIFEVINTLEVPVLNERTINAWVTPSLDGVWKAARKGIRGDQFAFAYRIAGIVATTFAVGVELGRDNPRGT